jgi:CDP-6-deoxy-D-xylo-4-hexulose-3-dehydrase
LHTLNFDLDQLKLAVSDNTKMILAVNLLGNPNHFDAIKEIIGSREIILMEDNCESMGAEFKGKQTGTFGLVGTFSTFFSHHMATMEGGLIVTDDEEMYHVMICLRAHGWTRHLPKENKISNKSDNWFEESFRFLLPGYNVRPVEMSGVIGVEQLKKLPSFLEQRRKNAELFISLFADNKDFYIQKDIDNSSWFGFSFIIKPESTLNRLDIVKKLEENNIDCRPIVTGDFTKNEVLKYFDCEIFGEMKNAQYLDKNGFFVGNHQIDLTEEIKHLHSVLTSM